MHEIEESEKKNVPFVFLWTHLLLRVLRVIGDAGTKRFLFS